MRRPSGEKRLPLRSLSPHARFLILSIEQLNAPDEIRCRHAPRQRFPLYRLELSRNGRVVNASVIDDNRKQKSFFIGEGNLLRFLKSQIPFHPKEAAIGSQRLPRNHRHKERALANVS